jgi:hypothetical protein
VFGLQNSIPSAHIYEALDKQSRLHDLTTTSFRRHGRPSSSPAPAINQTRSTRTWRISRQRRLVRTKKHTILESPRSVFAHIAPSQHVACRQWQLGCTHKQSHCLITAPGAPLFSCTRVTASQQALLRDIKLYNRLWVGSQELCWSMATWKDNRSGRLLYCSPGQTQGHWPDWCRKDHFQEDGRDGSCSKFSQPSRDARQVTAGSCCRRQGYASPTPGSLA